jgi:ribonuclease HI
MVIIWFDGLCEPNPDGIASFGYAIRGLSGTEPLCGCGVLDGAKGNTNNLAEWVALGKALAAVALSKAKVDELRILGDSRLVVEQLKGKFECKVARLATLRDRCHELLRQIGCPREKVKAEWIPREQNVEADLLARAAYVGRVGKPAPLRTPEPAKAAS